MIMILNFDTDISMRYNIIFVLDGNLYTLKPAPENVASNIPVVKKSKTKNVRRNSVFDVSEDEEVTTIDTGTGMKAKS